MIPRILVPRDVRPLNKDDLQRPAQRTTTYMDDRTVVPSGSSDAPPLDGKTSIPQHLPLGVLVNRTLVPRGMAVTRIERPEHAPEPLPLDILDSRVVVPVHVEPMAPEEDREIPHAPNLTPELREVIEPDLFITGDANLLIEPEVKRDANRLTSGSLTVLVHVGLIFFLIFIPKIFPAHVPTQQEIDLARQQLTYVLPEEPPEPARPPSPKLRITPKTLNRVAPPVEQPAPAPAPAPAPPKPAVELPEAPRPQRVVPPAPSPTPQQQQSELEPIPPIPRTPNQLKLDLPSATPGREIQNQLQDAIKRGSSGGIQVPDGPGIPRAGGGPGMGYGVQILTDTQGVDFNSYIQRLLATLKRNWEAVMPESAQLGDRGMVFTTFQVNHDGSVPSPDPQLERTSGKEPLDNAAMSAIHASNPFEPLPSQFKGQFIRLRIVFLYNLPPDSIK